MGQAASRPLSTRLRVCAMGLQQGGEAEPADHLLADAVHDQDGDIGAVRRRFDMDAERTLPKGRVDNHCNGA